MEYGYHEADRFRWALNSFLRCIKEVIQMATMEMQHAPELNSWLKQQKEELHKDELVGYLFKQRDLIVHRSMLKPASEGMVGLTKGRGLKLGIGMPIDPLEDSEQAILRYIDHAAREEDFLGILYTEDGYGEYTCVERSWRMEPFPEKELTELAAEAWDKVANLVHSLASRLGAKVSDLKFELSNANSVRIRVFEPDFIKENLEAAKEFHAKNTT
ncbi:hypothetical protein BST96_06380 [Oceanicoccus sagamiensis]|uniref:Uncharacterized protein n=2 Tax=Oceanicoccus sagamiensis TaxID=716816 RepID=A0A1X9NIX0_9GAMM|nr:hypothetical protein BST96_06380 [Oceanicoccus sagamiensis]